MNSQEVPIPKPNRVAIIASKLVLVGTIVVGGELGLGTAANADETPAPTVTATTSPSETPTPNIIDDNGLLPTSTPTPNVINDNGLLPSASQSPMHSPRTHTPELPYTGDHDLALALFGAGAVMTGAGLQFAGQARQA